MRPVPFYIRIYTVLRQAYVMTKKTQSNENQAARAFRSRFQTRLSQHQQTDTVSALSLDKSRAKKVHVSNVIYAFDWRRSGLKLAHTRFKCNFAVDFTMCLPNFWTSWCAATASFGKIGFSHHTPLQSESIRRTNASDSFCPWSRERWQRLRSIDETFGHLVDARVLFSPFVDV